MRRLSLVALLLLLSSPAQADKPEGDASILGSRVEGPLAARPVRTAVERGLPALRLCAARRLEEGGRATLELKLVIEAGRVSSAAVGEGASPALRDCVASAAGALRFPVRTASTRATVRVALRRLTATEARRTALQRQLLKLETAMTRQLKNPSDHHDVLAAAASHADEAAKALSGVVGGAVLLPVPSRGASGGLGSGRVSHGRAGSGSASQGRAGAGDLGLSDRGRRAQLLAAALRIPAVPRGPRAAWVQPALPLGAASPDGLLFDRKLVALGRDAAIVATSLHHRPDGQVIRTSTLELGLDAERGLRGVLRLPEGTRWTGLDGKDAVYAVTASGRVHRAASLDAAVAGSFVAAGQIAGAVTWAFSASRLAALLPDRVLVSTDRGQTFRASRPNTSAALERIALRHDDVIVVQDADRQTLISPDGGKRWQRSSFQPKELWSAGPWIYGRNECGEAVLATDRRTWVQTSLPDSLDFWHIAPGFHWEALLSSSEEPSFRLDDNPPGTGRGGRPGLFSPAAPAPTSGKPVVGAPRACTGYGVSGLGLAGVRKRGGCPLSMQGNGYLASCLRGTAGPDPEPALLWMGWLADGRKKAPARLPSLVVVDQRLGSLALASLPPGCTPVRVESLAGTAVLLCKAAPGRAAIFLADRAGAWHGEGEIGAPASELEDVRAAPDGTLLVQSCQFSQERLAREGNGSLCTTAFVRRPLALGAAHAWREVMIHDALAYRPLVGGRALVVERSGTGNTHIDFSVEDGARRRMLAQRVRLLEDPSDLWFDEGVIYVKLRGGTRFLSAKKTLELVER